RADQISPAHQFADRLQPSGPDAGTAGYATQELLEPAAPFGEVAARFPETTEGGCQLQPESRVGTACPAQRGAEIVMLAFEPFEPDCLIGARKLGLGMDGQVEEP